MNLSSINPSFWDWVPFYVFFKRAPTAKEIAFHRLEIAEKQLQAAMLSQIEAEGEMHKQERIIAHLNREGQP